MKLKKLLLITGIATLGLWGCNDEHDTITPEQTEYEFIRIAVTDKVSNQVTLLTPYSAGIETFEAQYASGRIYPTGSGQFAALIFRDNNYVQVFDAGVKSHGDHADLTTAGWTDTSSNGLAPTHFKSKGNEIIIFNDGSGTLSIGNENDFYGENATLKEVQANLEAHHGAMAKFDNGLYAVTEKDGSIAGSLPERVRIIDQDGELVYASTIQTKGIHGNASDGGNALFGSRDGVLVISSSGTQSLISYPETFGESWLGAIYYAQYANKFFGYTKDKGVYEIDVQNSQIIPLVETTDMLQCTADYKGETIIVTHYSGAVTTYNLTTATTQHKESVFAAVASDAESLPVAQATSNFLYLLFPDQGSVKQYDLTDLQETQTFAVSAAPFQMTLLGVETNYGH
ncbi:hypothetical protein V6R21_03445 [Limibacter armeniacum]|uniref:hypothetical protein n=1 Tax=Limibacter armeniacum TaxID=466084 RepID=UPI002FE59F47